MSRALAVLLSLLCPLTAAAQTPKRRRTPVAVPKTSAADLQAFEQTFEFILLQAGQSYLKDQAMPEPGVLDSFLTNLKEPELGKAKSNRRRLEDIIESAEWVQQGRASVAPDVYKLMVDQAADDLRLGPVVEEDFTPNGRAGRSLDAGERKLVKDCQAQARNQAYDRRGFYQSCLGHLRAEAVYLRDGRSYTEDASGAKNPAAARLLEEIAASRSKLPPGTAQDITDKLNETRNRLLVGNPALGNPLVTGYDPLHSSRPSFQRLSPRSPASVDTPYKQADGLKTSEPPLDKADLAAGTKLARVVKADEIGFTGYCYSYVKSALQKAGIVNRNVIGNEYAGHAKQFAAFVDKNPALLKRKLLRLPDPSWPLPIGTIVVWSAGACGYDETSGHIEIITRIKPPQACSDGCQSFQVACLNELAADPARAASELPQAQEELSAAQAAYDAAPAGVARRKAKTALLSKKSAAARVQGRLEARVAAYVVQR